MADDEPPANPPVFYNSDETVEEQVDKQVTRIIGPGWEHHKARLIVHEGTGYVFTDVAAPVASFDASEVRRLHRAGRVTIDGDPKAVQWSEHCGCRGKSPLPMALRSARLRDLVALIPAKEPV